jgi:Rieske Fe-S protein
VLAVMERQKKEKPHSHADEGARPGASSPAEIPAPADSRAPDTVRAAAACDGDAHRATHESPAGGRRGFIAFSTGLALAGGLAGYGAMAVMAGRFLYPAAGHNLAWQFLGTLDQFRLGEATIYVAPTGAKVVVARHSDGDTEGSFIALSSVCPHLGCQVHWEPHNDRFFCPCHNGAFDARGKATEGPPAAAGQSLLAYPLKVEKGLLYIEVPLTSVIRGEA